jgi:hypothetical protein
MDGSNAHPRLLAEAELLAHPHGRGNEHDRRKYSGCFFQGAPAEGSAAIARQIVKIEIPEFQQAEYQDDRGGIHRRAENARRTRHGGMHASRVTHMLGEFTPSLGRPGPKQGRPGDGRRSDQRYMPWILSEEEEHHVDAVRNSMRDYRHSQVATRAQVDYSQQNSHQPFVDDPRPPLIRVGQSKGGVNDNQADDPGAASAVEQVGNAIHQVPAVNHLFAKGREHPGQRNEDQGHFQVPDQRPKIFQVRLLPKQPHQNRLADEQFKSFQC